MTTALLDSLHRARFEWPEPLVLELIGESYAANDDGDRWIAARHHARFIRDLIVDETKRTSDARRELIADCAARGVALDCVEQAEQAVFGEIYRLVETRFRNSPRLKDAILAQMEIARQTLPKQPEPRKVSPFSLKRAPLRLRPGFATA